MVDLVLRAVKDHVDRFGDGSKTIFLWVVDLIRAADCLEIKLADLRPQIKHFIQDILPSIGEQLKKDAKIV